MVSKGLMFNVSTNHLLVGEGTSDEFKEEKDKTTKKISALGY